MRSLKYQLTFYHNHFLLGLKNLTVTQALRLYARLFDCHVLGHPPCNKSGSPIKIATRAIFYTLGFFKALGTVIQSLWIWVFSKPWVLSSNHYGMMAKFIVDWINKFRH